MATIKRGKRDSHFTILKNEVLRDKRLSYKARGLLAYMLPFDDEWTFYTATLINHSEKDGKDSINTGLKELINFGYLIKEQKRDNEGRFDGTEWIVIESPITDYPKADFPSAEKSSTENPQLRSNKLKNNNFKKEEEDTTNNIREDIYDKISFLYEKNKENGQKLLQIYHYLKNASADTEDIRKIIEYLSKNTQYLIAECIIKQHEACVFQSKTEEGLYDYEKYFLTGLKKRYKNQFLENRENTNQFKKVFGIKELPKITMHNWAAEGE